MFSLDEFCKISIWTYNIRCGLVIHGQGLGYGYSNSFDIISLEKTKLDSPEISLTTSKTPLHYFITENDFDDPDAKMDFFNNLPFVGFEEKNLWNSWKLWHSWSGSECDQTICLKIISRQIEFTIQN